MCVLAHNAKTIFQLTTYCNDPKFSDRQFWANSADHDQTRGAV